MNDVVETPKPTTSYSRDIPFLDVRYKADVLHQLLGTYNSILVRNGDSVRSWEVNYDGHRSRIAVNNPDKQHLGAAFASDFFRLYIYTNSRKRNLHLRYNGRDMDLSLADFQTEAEIDEIHNQFEAYHASSKIPVVDTFKNVTIFIGHGRSRLWRDLKDHLQDMHHFKVEAYETGARAGYTIQEVLKDMSTKASIALLVHTAEDVDREGKEHARENVVHETGLFQGKLGFKRAIVLLEEGTNEFSNIAGLQQIRFQKGNIKEVFGEVLAVLKREFGSR